MPPERLPGGGFGPNLTPARPWTKQRGEAREFALEVLRSTYYRESIRRRAALGLLPPAIESLLWHYAYGKPVERVELTAPGQIEDQMAEMSTDELRALAEETRGMLDELKAQETTIDVPAEKKSA